MEGRPDAVGEAKPPATRPSQVGAPRPPEENPLEDVQKFVAAITPLAQTFISAQQRTEEARIHEQGKIELARMEAAKQESEARLRVAQDALKTEREVWSRRDWMVLGVAAAMLAGGLVMVSTGKPTEGYVLLTSPLTGLLGYFAGGRVTKGQSAQ